MSDHCGECFPAAAELARLAENAQAGRREPFVGTGDPATILACAHGEWALGEAIAEPPRSCQATTRAGEPCKGIPGDDGLCAAHKPKESDAAGDLPPVVVGADPPQGSAPREEGGEEEAPPGPPPQVGGQQAG